MHLRTKPAAIATAVCPASTARSKDLVARGVLQGLTRARRRQPRSLEPLFRTAQLRCDSIFFRSASSLARSSPVGSLGAKSAVSNTWRISISAPGLNGARLTHSIASSLDLTCHSQKPAISSLASVKGPSITVGFPAVNRTRAPFELGWPLAREHHAGLHQLFVELPHLGQHLAIRQCTRFRV